MLEKAFIKEELNQLRKDLPPGSIWRHKKGGIYMVTGVAWDTEQDIATVTYFRIGGPGFDAKAERGIIFSRPAHMWKPDRFTEENPFRG